MSVNSADKISPELSRLFKDKAKVHCETADFLVMMTPEQRAEFRVKVMEKTVEANWQPSESSPYTHHMLFEVQNEEANNLPPIVDSDSSFEL